MKQKLQRGNSYQRKKKKEKERKEKKGKGYLETKQMKKWKILTLSTNINKKFVPFELINLTYVSTRNTIWIQPLFPKLVGFVLLYYYQKTGFASWWVSAKLHNQVKDREKEGCITCSK